MSSLELPEILANAPIEHRGQSGNRVKTTGAPQADPVSTPKNPLDLADTARQGVLNTARSPQK